MNPKRKPKRPRKTKSRRETHKSLRWLDRDKFLTLAAQLRAEESAAKYLANAPHDHDHLPTAGLTSK